MLFASRSGVVEEWHSHPNRLEYTGVNKLPEPVEDGAIGSVDVKSVGKFHCPRKKANYHKRQWLVMS
jgi:hypothetical protein